MPLQIILGCSRLLQAAPGPSSIVEVRVHGLVDIIATLVTRFIVNESVPVELLRRRQV